MRASFQAAIIALPAIRHQSAVEGLHVFDDAAGERLPGSAHHRQHNGVRRFAVNEADESASIFRAPVSLTRTAAAEHDASLIMDSDIYFILGIVLLVTLGWLLNLLARLFPPRWVEVLADCEFIGTPKRRIKTYYGIHLLRLSYEFEGKTYIKLPSIRYHLRTLERPFPNLSRCMTS
jgi:hypothetical protein